MTDIILTPDQKQQLEARHKKERDVIICDRIKAILLRSEGWRKSMIATALRIDRNTVANYISEYLESEKLSKNSGGKESKLNYYQTSELISHREDNLYVKTSDIVFYIKNRFNISYTIYGIRDLLYRNNFSYKKPKGLPLKANIKKQKIFFTTSLKS